MLNWKHNLGDLFGYRNKNGQNMLTKLGKILLLP